MPWWGWMIIGALMLGSELLGVDAAFYLVFIGIAAMIVGLIELAGLASKPGCSGSLFSVIAIVLMVLFRKKLYAKLRGGGVGYETGPAGEIVPSSRRSNPAKADACHTAAPTGPSSTTATRRSAPANVAHQPRRRPHPEPRNHQGGRYGCSTCTVILPFGWRWRSRSSSS